MTIQECYRQMGANYEDVLKRLYNEGMICRFTLMFLNDDSYPKLEQALKEGNVKEAFRAAHTLKGVCQNLGFTNLYQPTYDLTEVLRTGTLEGTKELFDSVTCQYKITIKGGKKYDDTAENEDGTYYYYAKAGDTVQLAFSGENGSHWSWNTAELPDGVIDAADDDPAHFTMPANAVTIEASAESKPVIPRAYRVQVQLHADVAFAEDAAPVTVSVPDTTGTDEDPKPDRTSTTALGAEPEQLVTLKFDAATLPEGYTFGQWVVTQLLPEQTTVEVTAGSDLEATFSMPASPVTVTFTVNAPVEPEPDPEPADDGGTGAVIAGALIGGTAYLLGTRAWLEGTYGYVPANRMELALGLWKRANCPAPVSTELYADIQQNDADAQAAARWCVEQGLLKDYHEQNDDGTETVTFKPGRYVARPYALTRWYQLEKLLDEQQAAQAETPAEAPAQISET